MILFALIVLPLIAAAFIPLVQEKSVKTVAMVGTLIPLGVGIGVALGFDWMAAGYQFETSFAWIEPMGLELSVGVDSVAMSLILLALLLGPVCVGASYTAITKKVRTYYTWLLVLQAAMVGVFAARDLIFFYICFEFTLVPMYIMISLYGSANRAKAATKFFLYTFTGSMVALAGLMYVAWFNASVLGNEWTFDIATLTAAGQQMSGVEQAWVMAAMLAGFAVKVPLFPFHTWLPLAHTEAPTAGSVILAGVLLKLGTYGIFRFVLPITPEAVAEFAPFLATLSIIGIIYAGLICWVQTDVKKLVAYSSVSHLGFCVLGLVALNGPGLSGSVLYMINHGLSTGGLFLLIGMIYERYHTRSMNELGGLAGKMPVWSCFMVFFAMASVGLPGLNGFVSEFLCMMGTFQADSSWAGAIGTTPGNLGPWFAAFAGTGVIVAAIYILYMVGKVCFGPLKEPGAHLDHGDDHVLPTDLCAREIGVLLPLAAGCLILGVAPSPLLKSLEAPITEITEIYTLDRGDRGPVLAPLGDAPAPVSNHDYDGGAH
ncbi:MAG: NADH-quinone oxidoreductase subunit M [Planctomycetota bacterium]